jgi:orotidine-5'-phosphate decarboxylase
MHYADRLHHRITQTSPVCVGLDPALAKLPEGITRDAKGVKEFCIGIIESTHDLVSCVKPQLAYFEVLGWEGMKALFEVCEYAKTKGLIVIADGKRNDIGPTCEAYAQAYLAKDAPFDALTVSPYLGTDGIAPFIEQATQHDKGLYILVKTSNASSVDVQDLPVGDEAVHEVVAQLVESLAMQHLGEHSLSCVGAVVGATYPEELKYLRTLMPHVPFLIPGYGAQGGNAEDIRHGFLTDGTGALVSASRSILFASSGSDWKEAARREAEKMRGEIEKAIGN